MTELDFNKEEMDLGEYIHLVEHVLRKHCKKFKFEHKHAQEVVDDVVDYLVKYDKKYDASNGASRSTYRWMVCLRRAIHVINKMKRDEEKMREAYQMKYNRKYFVEEDFIHKYEVNRLYKIVEEIVERRRHTNIKFQCFYDFVLQGKKGVDIARENSISTTLVGDYVAAVKKTLRNELIHVYGAKDWNQ